MITINCQSSIRITSNDLAVYFDLLNIDEVLHDADIIFITHAHWDHFSPDDITKVCADHTVAVAPADVVEKMSNLGFDSSRVVAVSPGQKLEIAGTSIDVVPAYNINKESHPKANNWVGYVV